MENPIQRKRDFYESNIGEPVNLYTGKNMTFSGDILDCDRNQGSVTLTNYILRTYNQEGSSFVESTSKLEINTLEIICREKTTREDRLGKIKSYNEELLVEKSEKRRKISEIEKLKPNNQITG